MFLRQSFNLTQRAKENPAFTEAVSFYSWQTLVFHSSSAFDPFKW